MAPRTNVTQRNNTQSMFNYWLIMLSVAIKPIMLSIAIKLRGLPWQALLANPNFVGKTRAYPQVKPEPTRMEHLMLHNSSARLLALLAKYFTEGLLNVLPRVNVIKLLFTSSLMTR